MKKLYTLIILGCLFTGAASAQSITVFAENFASYDSTSGPNYNGWYLSYSGFGSYYTSTTSSGPSGPNSYKFGRDSTKATTPMFSTTVDSVHFWMKGNGANGANAAGRFSVMSSSDSLTWDTLATYVSPISSVGEMKHLLTNPSTRWIQFYYEKDTGNVAFDDFSVTSNNVGLNTLSFDHSVDLYPTPTDGLVNINFSDGQINTPLISVYNLLGSKISDTNLERVNASKYTINLSSQRSGLYLVKIQTVKGTLTRRITVK